MPARQASNPIGLIAPTLGPRGPKPLPLLEQKIARVGQHERNLILSPSLWWFDIHFIKPRGEKGRTQPHLSDPERCPGCKDGLGTRAYAYLGGFSPRDKRRCILQMTARGACLSETLQRFNGDLRGRMLEWWRLPGAVAKDDSPVRYLVDTEKFPGETPPDFHVPFYLLRMWGFSHFLREWLKAGNPPPWAQQPLPSAAPPFEQEPPL